MNQSNQDIYKIAVSFIPGLGIVSAKKAVAYLGSVEALFTEKPSKLRKIPGFGELSADRFVGYRHEAIDMAEEELKYIHSNDIRFVSFWDDEYPSLLKECDDSPIILYYKGEAGFRNEKRISIVGTRNSTRFGTEFCKSIVKQLAERHPDVIVISGLALGIDAAAHEAALSNNLKTWAVTGHGFELIYPARHSRLAGNIVENSGKIITEYHHNSKIHPSNFVQRNRIIAGLSKAVLVVESAKRGGAMITADLGNQYNRDVFAVPGDINKTGGNGCNMLIKSHRASLCESIEDIEYITGWKPCSVSASEKLIEFPVPIECSEAEKHIIEILKANPYMDFDGLIERTNMSTGEISTCLLELEFKGIVRSLPGKIFSLRKA